jgi:hypothetical protein
MQNQRQDRIRERAYQIWEREGRQEGRAEEHWWQAEQELGSTEEAPASSSNGGPDMNGNGAATLEATPATNGGGAKPVAPKSRAPRRRRGSQAQA